MEITRHHLFWPRRAYDSKFERRFRTHPGLIVPVEWEDHKLLHHMVSPPTKPMHRDMNGLLASMREADHIEQQDPLWGLKRAIAYFEGITYPNERVVNLEPFDIKANLVRQLGYLTLNDAEAA